MEDFFRGKTALISGSSRGTGLALARALGHRGADIVLTARGTARLEQSRALLAGEGIRVAAIAGDVSNWTDAQAMVNCALDHFGRLDILVNNAGISMRGQFTALTPETCATVLNTNLLGSLYVSRAAIEPIRTAHGHIVMISSIAGIMGLPGSTVYCAAKKGLTGFAESLRLELTADGVHVGVVHLGFTEHDPEKRILGADGTALPADRPTHQTQAQAAAEIVRMLERRKSRLVLTPIGKIGAFAYHLSPAFVEWAISRAQRSQLKMFQEFS